MLNVVLGHCEKHGKDKTRERKLHNDSFSQVWIERLTIVQVVDVAPLEALSGPGPPDPDLARIRIMAKHGFFYFKYICTDIHIRANVCRSDSLDKSMRRCLNSITINSKMLIVC